MNLHDEVKSRKNDITFADKTDYDQKVAAIVTDYLDLYKKQESSHLIMSTRAKEMFSQKILRCCFLVQKLSGAKNVLVIQDSIRI